MTKLSFSWTYENKEKDSYIFDTNNKYPVNNIFAIVGKDESKKHNFLTNIHDIINDKHSSVISYKDLCNLRLNEDNEITESIAISFDSFRSANISSFTSLTDRTFSVKNLDYIPEHLLRRIENDKKKAMLFWKEIYNLPFLFDLVFDKYENIKLSDREEYEEIVEIELNEAPEGDDIFSRYDFYNKIEHLCRMFTELQPEERILTMSLMFIIANIEDNMVVLLDKPELYLYPTDVSVYINFVINIMKEYDALCVISTNSPIVLQELVHHNIYKVPYKKNPILEKTKVRTFGENLSLITDNLLHFDVKKSHFLKYLKENKDINKLKEILDDNYIGSEGRFYLYMLLNDLEEEK